MKEQLLDTWDVHHRMNKLVIDSITDTGFQKTLSTRGGRTIYDQWVHIHGVRLQWLEICDKEARKKIKPIEKDLAFDRELLIRTLDESARSIRRLLATGWDHDGKLKGFSNKPNKGVISFLGYLISHESHHRGNILLTLKQCGEKIPDVLKWGIWEWNK
jgi:uncharacterized damage-inducible protein DinB